MQDFAIRMAGSTIRPCAGCCCARRPSRAGCAMTISSSASSTIRLCRGRALPPRPQPSASPTSSALLERGGLPRRGCSVYLREVVRGATARAASRPATATRTATSTSTAASRNSRSVAAPRRPATSRDGGVPLPEGDEAPRRKIAPVSATASLTPRASIDDWFRLLNYGVFYTGMANSDTHTPSSEIGLPRNYVSSSIDAPAMLDRPELADNIRAGRVVASYGPFIELSVEGGSIGDTVEAEGEVELHLRVQSASWFDVDRIEVYANGHAPLRHRPRPRAPCDTDAELASTPRAKTRSIVNFDGTSSVTIPEVDTWYAVVAMGVSEQLPGAVASLLRQRSTRTWASRRSSARPSPASTSPSLGRGGAAASGPGRGQPDGALCHHEPDLGRIGPGRGRALATALGVWRSWTTPRQPRHAAGYRRDIMCQHVSSSGASTPPGVVTRRCRCRPRAWGPAPSPRPSRGTPNRRGGSGST